tara:strand:+ start:332 stop:1261 length:930 start_codon:yes stop_codon:yes gene_type:complete
MKIAFFTEGQWEGKVPRNNPNMRTEMAWMCALGSDHYNIHEGEITDNYDLGICIIPKKNPQFNVERIRKNCKIVASMQEGPHWYFQDYPLDQQIWFYNILQEMDFLFVHNEIDKKYFEGLVNKECIVMPSLMIEDSLIDIDKNITRKGVMIGGNFCSWYGGFDSYIVAQKFETEIQIPSMGRRIEGEEQMPNLNHLPYMNWASWIHKLNSVKYGVHLMRTHAAGTFALNCAYLGIPCIGYNGLDSQMICHPDCTVDFGDITKANYIADKLKTDEDFYHTCSETAKFMYANDYTEVNYKTKILGALNGRK